MSQNKCPECGETFKNSHGVQTHIGRTHGQPYHDKATLKQLYEEDDLSTLEIAEKFGVEFPTILHWMDKHGIERSWSRDPSYPPYHEFRRRHDRVGSVYETITTSVGGKNKTVRIHRLIAYAHGIIGSDELFDPNTVVHHKSEHGLDNRPGNLESMSRSDHMSYHNKRR